MHVDIYILELYMRKTVKLFFFINYTKCDKKTVLNKDLVEQKLILKFL